MSISGADQVRDFYERLPYPPPTSDLEEHRARWEDPRRRRAVFHRMWPGEIPRVGQEILIAGCGTMQAARYALRDPDAHITAIDVSEASLRHTAHLRRKYGLHNLDICHLAIEDVHQLGATFDQVVCTGVLHHLADPDLGLRALRGVLQPRGAMQLMVYAPYGRAGIYMMQEDRRLLNVSTSEEDLRDLGATLTTLPEGHPISTVLPRAREFRRSDSLADALLHPRDRAFSVPELYAWLGRCGMTFGRWVEQAPYLPDCGALGSSPHAARLAALPLRVQHAAVELLRGTMVSHSVIAYRDDRGADGNPITFTTEDWKAYVPLPMPWTVCVRERVPPGSVAVLINRAHMFTDLVCTVDRFEAPLLNAIDGTRTLAGILEATVDDADGRARALHFFERLWRYDQIVFDASGAAEAAVMSAS